MAVNNRSPIQRDVMKNGCILPFIVARYVHVPLLTMQKCTNENVLAKKGKELEEGKQVWAPQLSTMQGGTKYEFR